ncbi:hypothetical protein GCM10016455_05950 [Aliiroseovarius zhejiangensis]|uniref:Right handed beta helix domain-containing protein n=1 Tax=Aliiroseovarius zhejiangensis TaxID=1632025 RepID=A0ABQ3INA4_9RHOB|nr:right-handed parallel beta-helix repeat-containing protein [Aliiroseovarius zhejiangensis]GHE88623.1 hypothetical protein GCM10016455_05950 [Aliiroseovarius zhejiangensis]
MTTHNVTTHAELMAALEAASGGDEIVLAPGDYGRVSLDNSTEHMTSYDSEVVIRSADPDDRAVLTSISDGSVKFGRCHNMTLRDLTFTHVYQSGDPKHLRSIEVMKSTNIKLENCQFFGAFNDEGTPTSHGLTIEHCSNVTVTGCEVKWFHRGTVMTDTAGLTVTNNNIHSLRSDGMDFAAVQDVLIADNWIHDFLATKNPGDHRDMIQFWTNGTNVPSERVTIRDNILDIGMGGWQQSIFIRNEEVDNGRAGREMFYRDFVIQDNYIRNCHLHGITTGEFLGLTIHGNILISEQSPNMDYEANAYHFDKYNARSMMRVPTIRVNPASENVVVTGNAFYGAPEYHDRKPERIFDTQTDMGAVALDGWTIADNVIDAASTGPDPGAVGNPDPAPNPDPTPDPDPEPTPDPDPQPEPVIKVVYASNGGAVADGLRITRISEGGTKFEILVDEKTERFSEVRLS